MGDRHGRWLGFSLVLMLAILVTVLASRGDDRPQVVAADEPNTTVESLPSTTATTQAVVPGTDHVVLRGDGLGLVRFGDRADEVVDKLTELYGLPVPNASEPDAVAAHYVTSPFAGCAQFSERRVEWSATESRPIGPELVVGFDRGSDGHEVLTAYAHFFTGIAMSKPMLPGIPLTTERGLSLFMPMADAEARHPDASFTQVLVPQPQGGVLDLRRVETPSGLIYVEPQLSGVGNADWEITDRAWLITAGAVCDSRARTT